MSAKEETSKHCDDNRVSEIVSYKNPPPRPIRVTEETILMTITVGVSSTTS